MRPLRKKIGRNCRVFRNSSGTVKVRNSFIRIYEETLRNDKKERSFCNTIGIKIKGGNIEKCVFRELHYNIGRFLDQKWEGTSRIGKRKRYVF